MAITLREMLNAARNVLGGADNGHFSEYRIVNSAGQHLYGMANWNFRQREPLRLDVEGGQPYIDLPADMGEITEIRWNGLTTDIYLTTPASLAKYRDHDLLPTSFRYWATVVFPKPSTSKAPPAPRLELFPVPDTSQAEIIQLWYTQNWVTMSAADSAAELTTFAPVPQYCEPLLISIIQAFALSWVDDQSFTADQRLAVIQEGPTFEAAVRRDSQVQPLAGPSIRSAVEEAGKARGDFGYLPWDGPQIAPSP